MSPKSLDVTDRISRDSREPQVRTLLLRKALHPAGLRAGPGTGPRALTLRITDPKRSSTRVYFLHSPSDCGLGLPGASHEEAQVFQQTSHNSEAERRDFQAELSELKSISNTFSL